MKNKFLSEQYIINKYLKKLNFNKSESYNFSNDGAFFKIPKNYKLIVTNDTIIENVDFFKSDPPKSIANKIITCNLSDISSMGAVPYAYTLSLCLPKKLTNEWLYLFTKNRTEPFDGITNVYKVGDHAANFDAQLIDSFKTCTTMEKLCWITSAALSPDRKKLALLDSTSIWLFENFKGDKFFSGDVYKIDLGIVTQKEAITFYDDNTLIFTDEEFKGLVGGNAYVIKLNEAQKTVIRQAPKAL